MVGLLGIVKQISMGSRIRELNGKLKKAEGESATLKNKLENVEKQIAEEKAVLEPEAQKPAGGPNTVGPAVSEKDSKKSTQETLLNPTIPFPKE